MILRRITQALRRQDWFTVFVETMIVVMGVFLGIQVANWNDAQQSKVEAARLLGRLETDLIEMRQYVQGQQQSSYRYAVASDDIMTSIETGKPLTEEKAAAAMSEAFNASLPPSPPLSFNDMMSSGRLDLLDDARTRDALQNFAHHVDFSGRAANFLVKDYRNAVHSLSPYVAYERKPMPEIGDNLGLVKKVDTARLQEEDAARAALADLFIFHANMQGLSERSLQSIDEVLAAINEESSK